MTVVKRRLVQVTVTEPESGTVIAQNVIGVPLTLDGGLNEALTNFEKSVKEYYLGTSELEGIAAADQTLIMRGRVVALHYLALARMREIHRESLSRVRETAARQCQEIVDTLKGRHEEWNRSGRYDLANQCKEMARGARDCMLAVRAVSIEDSRATPMADREAGEQCAANGARTLTDDQIKHMVDRFLFWRLPEHFLPDAGISFEPEYNVEYNAQNGHPPSRHEPRGTNLFDAQQAEAMVRHMIEDLPMRAPRQL